MRRRALVAAAALCLARAAAAAGQAEPLELAEYERRLGVIADEIAAGRFDEARAGAGALRSTPVAWAGETLAPDLPVLDAIVAAHKPAEVRAAAHRLERLLAALGAGVRVDTAPESRPDLLARVTQPDPLRRGGDVATLRVKPLSFPERVEAALLAFADWLGAGFRRLLEWLRSLKPRDEPAAPTPGRTAAAAIAFALAVVVVLATLVIRARRGRTARLAPEALPIASSARDEDPLSRDASAWEQLAAQLASARRFREAIRAWYHAVLVSLFGAGLLHHQRGRTNWEYVSRLEPDLAWRPAFVALTRLFDREWYGRRSSEPEALAECARTARAILAAVHGARRSR